MPTTGGPADDPLDPVARSGAPPGSSPGSQPGGEQPGGGQPVGGQARELSRRRSARRRYPDTGRRHHLGAAPVRMPVYGEDGSIVGTTRTSAHQLASLTVVQLDRLADALRAEMADAAAGLDFELAAGLRDELAAVTAERTRR